MKREARFHAEAGLSFPELLVVSAILITLVALLHSTFRYQTMAMRRESSKVVTQTDLRIWLERMVHDIRSAGYDPLEKNRLGVLFTIDELSPTEIRFKTDYNGNGLVGTGGQENIGYRLNGDVLQLWNGASWRPVLRGVTSLTLTCADAQGDALTCSETPASIRRSVSAIHIVLTAQAETGGVPTMGAPVITQKATAELRNEIF